MSNKTSDKNVANIEDDVNELKRLLYSDTLTQYAKRKLVNYYEQRIQELEEEVKMLDEAYTGTIKESKKWFDIAHNSIPKQVVIDKIEELGISDEDINIKYVLQELLERRK